MIKNKRGHKVPGSTKDQIRKIKNKQKTKLNLKNLGQKGPKNGPKIGPKTGQKTHSFIYLSIFFFILIFFFF